MSYDIPALRTLILTHRAKISDEIFETLKRFQEQMPEEIRMSTTQSNDYRLTWKNLSQVNVGTAGTDSARGYPCLFLELSELGRCKDRHVKDIQEGAMNAHAAAEPGNILAADSTSGGEGNYFHEIAKSGWKNSKSSWFTCFFGWHEMPEYRLVPPKGWYPDSEEVKLMKTLNADVQQIYWRHVKLHEKMRSNVTAFQREYPASFEEAFSSAENKLIDSVVMLNALNSMTEVDPTAAKILGVDPAGQGDRTALVLRQGYVITKYWVHNRMDAVTLAGIIQKIDQVENLDHVFIDMGYGHGTYDVLRKLNFGKVTGVHFGSTKVYDPLLYVNMRSEMAAKFQDWMGEGPDGMGGTARIPDTEEFQKDIKMIPDLQYSGEGQKFKLATKEEIKEELGKSPDIFDATILTFAHPVRTKKMLEGLLLSPNQPQQGNLLVTNNVFQEMERMTGYGDSEAQNPHFNFYSFGN